MKIRSYGVLGIVCGGLGIIMQVVLLQVIDISNNGFVSGMSMMIGILYGMMIFSGLVTHDESIVGEVVSDNDKI